MSFNWIEYLHLAQNLIGQEVLVSDEAKRRAAISRAYYAVYNEARKLARLRGFAGSQLDNHRALIEYFHNEALRECKSIGANVQRLREWRNNADYDGRVDKLDYLARTTVSLAVATLDQIHKLRERNV